MVGRGAAADDGVGIVLVIVMSDEKYRRPVQGTPSAGASKMDEKERHNNDSRLQSNKYHGSAL